MCYKRLKIGILLTDYIFWHTKQKKTKILTAHLISTIVDGNLQSFFCFNLLNLNTMTYQEAKKIVNQSIKEDNVHLDWYEWQSIYEVLSEYDEDDSSFADYAREKANEMYHIEEYNCDLL